MNKQTVTPLPQKLRVRDYDPTEKLWAWDTDNIAWGWHDATMFADIRTPSRNDAVISSYSGWEITWFEGLPIPDQFESGCDDAWRWVETTDGRVWALVSIDVEDIR